MDIALVSKVSQVMEGKIRSEQKGGDLPLGHKSYATKKQKLWNAFQKKAKERFGIYLE